MSYFFSKLLNKSLFIKFTSKAKLFLLIFATSNASFDISDKSIFKSLNLLFKVKPILPLPQHKSNIFIFLSSNFYILSIAFSTNSSVSNLGIKTLLSTKKLRP